MSQKQQVKVDPVKAFMSGLTQTSIELRKDAVRIEKQIEKLKVELIITNAKAEQTQSIFHYAEEFNIYDL